MPKFGQKWIFLGKAALSVFRYFSYLLPCQKPEKNMGLFLRKMSNWQTDFSSDYNSFAGTVPKAPKTIGTIAVFTQNCLLTSATKSIYLSIFSASFSLTWWSIGTSNVPCVLPINHYHIWFTIIHFPISLYWSAPAHCYFAIICLCCNIGYMDVISCRDTMLLE